MNMKLSEVPKLTGLIEIRWRNVIPPVLPGGGYEVRFGNDWRRIESDAGRPVSGADLAQYQGAIHWNKIL